ncbi:helix-turn-helix transcriptional regulator [Allosphingosinicella humi]
MHQTSRNHRKHAGALFADLSASNGQYQNQQLTPNPSTPERLIKLDEVRRLVGLGKTMIYQMIADGRFPRQVGRLEPASPGCKRPVDRPSLSQSL